MAIFILWNHLVPLDGPGVRFVVFFEGCPMRCQYCHNPDTWVLTDGKQMEADEIIDRFLREEDLRIVAARRRTRGGGVHRGRAGRRRPGRERGTGGNLSCPGASGQSHSDLSQIKFVKSGKKCLLCVAY